VSERTEPLSVESPRAHVTEALERTLELGSAQLELHFEPRLPDDFGSGDAGSTSDKTGPVARRVWRWLRARAWRAFRWGGLRLMERWIKQAAQAQRGVVEFAAHRCMYGHDPAILVVEDRSWSGASGESIDRLSPHPATAHQPLWLLNLLRGAVDGEERGVELLRGRRCTRFDVQSDVLRAADALSYGMALPPGASRVDELRNTPVQVWIDDEGHLRRARQPGAGPGPSVLTLDLTEFGVPLPADWSRLSDDGAS
jgi:hypothetical protein